jgi:sensor histidine kinase YesM
MVPPLILQPLVENAVLHGLAGRSGRMHLGLRALDAADHVTIVVSHDGPELPPDWAPRSGRGVGLRNTRERLASAFGANASLVVRRRVGGGVETRMHVPAPARQPAVDDASRLQPA